LTFLGSKEHATAIAVAPDDRTLAVADYESRSVQLFDTSDGRRESRLDGLKGDVSVVAFAPDSRVLATGGKDQAITVWRVVDGKALSTFDVLHCHSMAFSPDGKSLAADCKVASASGPGFPSYLYVWAIDSGLGKRLRMTYGAASLCYSPDGRYLAFGSGDLYLLDMSTFGVRKFEARHRAQGMPSVQFSADGRKLFYGSHNHEVNVWDVDSPQNRFVLHERQDGGCVDRVLALHYRASEDALWTACYDDTVRVWDLKTGRLTDKISLNYPRDPKGQDSLWKAVFSKDGARLYAATSVGTVMVFGDLMKRDQNKAR
jgi:WD40 repeat protein